MDQQGAVRDASPARRTWTVVVPVKDSRRGKTRLSGALSPGQRAALVRAMALDTAEAATTCERVAAVLVVTADRAVAAAVASELPGRTAVLGEPTHTGARSGLDAAVLAGVAAARRTASVPVAVLLGDVPALAPADLAEALDAADGVDRGLVTDAAGTGTTLLTVSGGVDVDPRFGAGSAAAHRALGHRLLEVAAGSTLHQDVDVPEDLAAAARLRLGSRTAALLASPSALA